MAGSFSDRNLLLGILALQLEFVSRDELIQAFQAWTLNKQRSLGQILEEHKRLTTADRQALEKLVGKVTDAGRGGIRGKKTALPNDAWDSAGLTVLDPETPDDDERPSFAESPRSVLSVARTTYQAAELPLNQIEREALSSPEDPAATRMPVAAEMPASPDRYHVIRLHREGGLAQVYVAVDVELKREVALKQIKSSHADEPDSRNRFMQEAEITGGLEHPAIVPVYSLGQYADGRPYYAMRFIEGETLQEVIESYHAANLFQDRRVGDRELGLRKLLSQFITVCEAMDYAHSQGVIHRDLKPSNIMIGAYGETLVVDWGLAKRCNQVETSRISATSRGHSSLTGSQSTHTQLGSVVGTAQYMSPEQAAGRHDKLGPASDIYSLGAVLYTLLTGKSPFEGRDSIDKILADARRGMFRHPREVNKDVPAGLEAICLKAMAFSPEARYPAARAIVNDVEHWLADEPISAYHESPTRRLARKVRHHKGATIATLALLVTTAVMLTSLSIYKIKNDASEAAKTQIDRQASLAFKTLNGLLDKVSEDALIDEKSSTVVRTSLLQYYKDYAASLGDLASPPPELAEANERMAKIANGIGATKDQVLIYYKEANDIYEQLTAQNPERLDLKGKLYRIWVKRGIVLYEKSEYKAAERLFEEARDQLEELHGLAPKEEEFIASLAEAWHNLAIVRTAFNNPEALEAYSKGLNYRQYLYNRNRDKWEYQRDLAASHGFLGDYLLEAGDWTGAETHYKSSEQLREAIKDSKGDDEAKLQYSRGVRNLAFLNCRRHEGKAPDNYEKAIQLYKQTMELQTELTRSKPNNDRYLEDLAYTASIYGGLCLDAGQPEDGLVAVEKGVESYRMLVEKDHTVPSWRTGWARSLLNQAKYHLVMMGNDPADGANDVRMEHAKAVVELIREAKEFLPDMTSSSKSKETREGEDYYLAAQANAMLYELKPQSDSDPLHDPLLTNAMKAIDAAVGASLARFTDIDLLRRDRSLKSLREQPTRKQEVEKLVEKIIDKRVSISAGPTK